MSDKVVHCLVSGRAQGVWYRASAQKKARELGLCGRVSNLATGDVEVVAAGSPSALTVLCQWLWEGPAGAGVSRVTVSETDEIVDDDFRVV